MGGSWVRRLWAGRGRKRGPGRRGVPLKVEGLEERLVPAAPSLVFGPPVAHQLGPVSSPDDGTPTAIAAAGDLNHDGKADLVTVNAVPATATLNLDGGVQVAEHYDLWSLGIYAGNGNGTLHFRESLPFQTAHPIAPNPPWVNGNSWDVVSVALGDFNHDGNLDVAAVSSDGTLDVFLGDGGGDFRALTPVDLGTAVKQFSGWNYNISSFNQSLAVGNFAGGGRLDLAVLTSSGNIEIFAGNGDGTFSSSPWTIIPPAAPPIGIVAGDFNHDGVTDLAVLSQGASGPVVSVMASIGGSLWPLGSQSAGGAYSLAAGDFYGNGNLDLAGVGTAGLEVLKGNGDWTFQPAAQVGTDAVVGPLLAADLNGDGKPDLVGGTGNTPYSASTYYTLLNESVVPANLRVTGPTKGTAGHPVAVTVTALTAGGQTDTGFADTVHFSGAVGLPADYTFTAADHGSHTFEVTLNQPGPQTITVADTSDGTVKGSRALTVNPAPQITAPASLPGATMGQPYRQTITASGGTGPLSFAVPWQDLPPGLSLDAHTGVLSGTPSLTLPGTFTLHVTVTDSLGATATRSLSLTVNPALRLQDLPVPADTVGRPLAERITAAGGTGPVGLRLAPGASLPPGLTFDAQTGMLSGTPSHTGAFSFTVVATDSRGATASRAYTLTVNPAPHVTGPASLPAGKVGQAYRQTITAAGGTGALTFSLGAGSSLPPGLALDAATGVLSGSPRKAGTFTFRVVVTDSKGVASAAIPFTVVVKS